jgi:BirA family biotin operon repressor/biotin-[acetyl-CoA-carboxylase] ligase
VTVPVSRNPFDVAAVPDGWRLEYVAETGSTNADLLSRAAAANLATRQAGEVVVLVADYQHGGRGRLQRTWASPPRAGLTFSVLLRPRVDPSRRTWLPLLAGLALVDVLGARAGLKWPNDVLIDGRKVAGVLVQSAGEAVVIGVGVNVTTTPAELPVTGSTSLAVAGLGPIQREALLSGYLSALGSRLALWSAAGGDAERSGVAAAYRAASVTIGTDVAVHRGDGPSGRGLSGRVVGIDECGYLQVRESSGIVTTVAAGDVTGVRPAG